MHLIGPANWAIPGWLDRILPRLAVEGAEQAPAIDQGRTVEADLAADTTVRSA